MTPPESGEATWTFNLREHMDPRLGYYEVVVQMDPDDEETVPWGKPMVPAHLLEEAVAVLEALRNGPDTLTVDGARVFDEKGGHMILAQTDSRERNE